MTDKEREEVIELVDITVAKILISPLFEELIARRVRKILQEMRQDYRAN